MAIAKLPAELVVELAEHMDIVTMTNFRATNKVCRVQFVRSRELTASKSVTFIVKSYERSICKSRTKKFVLPPIGNVLSSYGPERRILTAVTFHSVLELELREARIDSILQSGFIDTAGPPGLDPLTPRKQERFVELLMKALYHCDRIADIAANIPKAGIPGEYYDLVSLGIWDHSASLPGQLRSFDPFANSRARTPQIEYLKALSLEDLSAIYIMISVAGAGWVRAKNYVTEDPNVWERLTVFEECILRHGSWFLWGQVTKGTSSSTTLREMTGHMLAAGLTELMDWETGKADVLPGLRMSLLEAVEGKIETEEHVINEIYKLVMKIVKGSDASKQD
ncbi:hypothetical protein BJ170DRAFT_633330 [Xylariales sp. AK1849]|nr:hypothetical protein BJ170DRAFT_633330 [Xylariales sp. AK1849]